jgi:hypothetical protein
MYESAVVTGLLTDALSCPPATSTRPLESNASPGYARGAAQMSVAELVGFVGSKIVATFAAELPVGRPATNARPSLSGTTLAPMKRCPPIAALHTFVAGL